MSIFLMYYFFNWLRLKIYHQQNSYDIGKILFIGRNLLARFYILNSSFLHKYYVHFRHPRWI